MRHHLFRGVKSEDRPLLEKSVDSENQPKSSKSENSNKPKPEQKMGDIAFSAEFKFQPLKVNICFDL